MSLWTVQQKVELWRETTIEADSLEQALDSAQNSSTNWELLTLDWVECDEYWIENQTGESFTIDHTGTHQH